jgi:hypothetical protein
MKFIQRPLVSFEPIERVIKNSAGIKVGSKYTPGDFIWNKVIIDFGTEPVAIGMHFPMLTVEDTELTDVIPLKFVNGNQFVVECSYSSAKQLTK